MRQKSKQQAKIEATQKLEQVKNEQQQQQQLQQLGSQQLLSQSGSDTPSSGMQSPLTPQTSNGSMSPAQQTFHKDLFTKQLPGTPTSSPSDVFLKPQAPPPPATPNRKSVQEAHSQNSSQQIFSPTRPPSPVDPYAKMVGTPRPAAVNQNQNFIRRNAVTSVDICPPPSPISRPVQVSESMGSRPSPARDSCSLSPISNDPYAKPPDTPRPVMAAEAFTKPLGVSKSPLIAEKTGKTVLTLANDPFTKPAPRTDTFQRPHMSPTDSHAHPQLPSTSVVEGGSGSFKTPMRPPQPLQEQYASMPSTPRRLERPVLTPRPVDSFSHNSSNDPYSQPPLTPHPAIKEAFAHPQRVVRNQSDSFSQSGTPSRATAQDPYAQPPGTPRPITDPYAQPPGTPRPITDPYAQPPGTPRPITDPYAQPPGTPRPATVDPYMHQPPTPRPAQTADLFAQVPANQKHSDPYAQPPGTPRPISNDVYSQQPATPRPGISETFSRPALMANRDPFLPPTQNRTLPVSFVRPSDPCSQPPRPPGPAVTDAFSHASTVPSCDPYDQPPMTPRPQPENFGSTQLPHDIADQPRSGSEGNFSASANSSMNLQGQQFPQSSHIPGPTPTAAGTNTQTTAPQGDAEKLRQVNLILLTNVLVNAEICQT